MVSLVTRNVRENNSPAPLHDDLAQIETEAFYGESYLELSERAVKVNFLYEEFVGVVNKAVFIAIEMGKELEIIQNDAYKSGITFEKFLAEKCTKIKSSRAYDFIAFSKRPDLQELGLQSSGLLLPSHLIELLSAPSDVIEQVQEKVDAGEKVSVSEIKKYKQAAKKAEEDAAKARKDADEWRVSMQTQQAINQQNMDLIEQKAEEKATEKFNQKVEQIKESAAAEIEADMQATIDSLNDSNARLLARLATIERTDEKQQIEDEIETNKATLQALNVQKNQAEYEKGLRELSQSLVGRIANYKSALIALGKSSLTLEIATFNTLMDAHDELGKFSEYLFEIANHQTLVMED